MLVHSWMMDLYRTLYIALKLLYVLHKKEYQLYMRRNWLQIKMEYGEMFK